MIEQWKKDEQSPFQGWDFYYLRGRMVEEKPPWDYMAIAKELVKKSKAVLDMGTGGGERFAELAPFTRHALAIEGFKPNVSVAKKRLEPLGVKVIEADESDNLPFKDGEFDLVLNRHSTFKPSEVFRILETGGIFLTQQVGPNNLRGLIQEFGAQPQWQIKKLDHLTKELSATGFTIKKAQDWRGKVIYQDVGAIVYQLKAIPWIVKGFSVENNLNHLKKLQDRLEGGERLEFEVQRYLIHAEK